MVFAKCLSLILAFVLQATQTPNPTSGLRVDGLSAKWQLC